MTVVESTSSEMTLKAGFDFAARFSAYDNVIGLSGELGSGKTVFVKGFAGFFNVKDVVNSPTYLIVNEYSGIAPGSGIAVTLFHFDLYRINFIEELEVIGFRNYIETPGSIILIEWCGIVEEHFNIPVKKVYFEYGKDENTRIIKY